MKKHSAQVVYCLLQSFVWGLYGVLIGYSHTYLLRRFPALSNTAVSLTMAVACVVSVVLQFILTELSAKYRQLTMAALLTVLGALLSGAAAALLCAPQALWLVAGLYMLAAVCNQILPAFANAMGMSGLQRGVAVNFGVARGLGSGAYSLTSLITGQLLTHTGTWVIPAMSALYGLGMIASTLLFTGITGSSVEPERERASEKRPFFRENPWFFPFLLGCVCLFLSHNLLSNFMYQIAVYKGGGAAEQGKILSLAGILELPTMFCFGWMLKKWPCDRWVRLCPIFFALRSLGMLLAPTFIWELAAQLAHMLGFALYAVATAYYVAAAIPKEQVVRGQSYLFAASSIGSVLSLLVGGPVLDHFGARVLLVLSIAFGLLGFVIYQCSVRSLKPAAV